MYLATEVARAVLTRASERGCLVDCTFLHRAVYLVWLDCLRYDGRRLFKDDFTVGPSGPTVTDVAEAYGYKDRTLIRRFVPFHIPGRPGRLLEGTVDRCLSMDRRVLTDLVTGFDTPWARCNLARRGTITYRELTDYVSEAYPDLLVRSLVF